MSNEQIAQNADREYFNQVLPLTEFLKKQIQLTTDEKARASFESSLQSIRARWPERLKPEQRARGLAQVAKLKEMIQLTVKDNRAQYRSKLAALGGAK